MQSENSNGRLTDWRTSSLASEPVRRLLMEQTGLQLVRQFYECLSQLEVKIGEKRILENSAGSMGWPERGVYFFFEPGEERTTSGEGLRCVRVGTHALKTGSNTTLWNRLSQHRGTVGGFHPRGGNHRGSIFRLHVGTALMARDQWPKEIARNWGGSNAPRMIKEAEVPYEQSISHYIGSMPFLWLGINDEPGPESLRGYVERNAIALLSNVHRIGTPIDPPSQTWLGRWAKSPKIRDSGLWNSNHVDDFVNPHFLETLNSLI